MKHRHKGSTIGYNPRRLLSNSGAIPCYRSGRPQLLALLLSPQISKNSNSTVEPFYSTPIVSHVPTQR